MDIKGIIVTRGALEVALYEEGLSEDQAISILSSYARVYREHEMTSPLASSSNQPDAMAIVPASTKTIGMLAAGITGNLVTRAALAIMRLGRRLVVAPRETPLGTVELRNMLALSEMGALIVPLTLSFYIKPRTVDDLVGFAAGKVLDALGIDNSAYNRWAGIEDGQRGG